MSTKPHTELLFSVVSKMSGLVFTPISGKIGLPGNFSIIAHDENIRDRGVLRCGVETISVCVVHITKKISPVISRIIADQIDLQASVFISGVQYLSSDRHPIVANENRLRAISRRKRKRHRGFTGVVPIPRRVAILRMNLLLGLRLSRGLVHSLGNVFVLQLCHFRGRVNGNCVIVVHHGHRESRALGQNLLPKRVGD